MTTQHHNLKTGKIIFLILTLLGASCHGRANQDCDLTPVISCSFLYSTDAEVQTCANKANTNSCTVADLNAAANNISSNISTNPTNTSSTPKLSYTCQDQMYTLAAKKADLPVTYIFEPGIKTVVVDPSLSAENALKLLTDSQKTNVTATIQAAINRVGEHGNVVLCPALYEEAVLIDGHTHDNLKIMNIMAGDKKMAPLTILSGRNLVTPFSLHDTFGVTIAGLTIQDGLGNEGGGVAISNYRISTNTDFTVQLLNDIITNNNAISGGGIYIEGYADVSVENSDLLANSATMGGAFFIAKSGKEKTVQMIQDNITENSGIGSAGFVESNNTLLMNTVKIQQNQSGLTADSQSPTIAMSSNSILKAYYIDWGNGTNENQGSDLVDEDEIKNKIDLGDLLWFASTNGTHDFVGNNHVECHVTNPTECVSWNIITQ